MVMVQVVSSILTYTNTFPAPFTVCQGSNINRTTNGNDSLAFQESQLINKLLGNGYNKKQRPTQTPNETVQVDISLSIQDVIMLVCISVQNCILYSISLKYNLIFLSYMKY